MTIAETLQQEDILGCLLMLAVLATVIWFGITHPEQFASFTNPHNWLKP